MAIVRADQPAEFRPYITTTKGMSGHFAVMMWYNNRDEDYGGFWEPYDTGVGRYATRDEAINEAKSWAAAEGVQYRA